MSQSYETYTTLCVLRENRQENEARKTENHIKSMSSVLDSLKSFNVRQSTGCFFSPHLQPNGSNESIG